MKPSLRILEQNLEQLMRRAYRPVRPREAFVQQLEEVLAPYIREAAHPVRGPGRILRPVFVTGLLAVAAVLLLFGWSFYQRAADTPGGVPVASLDSILDSAPGAARWSSKGAWRPLSAEEMGQGVTPLAGFVELATSNAATARVIGSAGWSVQLAAHSRLDVVPSGPGLQLDLRMGSAHFEGGGESRETAAPARVFWRGGSFYDADGTRWISSSEELPGLASPSGRLVQQTTKEPQAEPEAPTEELPDPTMGTIRGVVQSSLDGKPVNGFDVSLLRSVALPQVAQTRTMHFDGDTFEWTDLKPGDYEVYVTAPEHAVWRRTEVSIRAGDVWQPEVLLDAGATLRGFVVEKSTGAGLAGALVVSDVDMPAQVIGMGEEYFPKGARAFTYTQSDGSFEFPLLSFGKHNLRAAHGEFAPSWVEVQVGVEQRENLLFELSPGGKVSGRCEHPDGKPFASAMVIVSRFSQGSGGRTMTFEQAWTSEEGRYSVENLAPGGYVVLFFGAAVLQETYQPQYQPIVVREGSVLEANFLGQQRGASVRGTVFGPDKQPIPFANLHTLELAAGDTAWKGDTTDENGEYEIVGLTGGTYHIFAGDGNATALGAHLTLEDGDRIQRDIHLGGTDLRVRVVDDQTGEPVELVEISLDLRLAPDSNGVSATERMARVFHAAGDLAELKYLGTGTYDLLVIADSRDYGVQVVQDVWVDINDPVGEVEVRLVAGCLARLDVLDGTGNPISGARVRVLDQRGGDWTALHSAATDQQGGVRFSRLPPGPLRFEVSHGLHGTRWVELVCVPDQPLTQRVTLSGE